MSRGIEGFTKQMKLAKEIAKRNGWSIRYDRDWEDIIVKWKPGATSHFYLDLEDAIHTMLHQEKVKRGEIPGRVTNRRIVKSNPSKPVVIYGQVDRILATKTQRHRCDPGCKKAGHRYYHDFKPGAVMYGLPDKSILIKAD